jgi:hypothetical protein
MKCVYFILTISFIFIENSRKTDSACSSIDLLTTSLVEEPNNILTTNANKPNSTRRNLVQNGEPVKDVTINVVSTKPVVTEPALVEPVSNCSIMYNTCGISKIDTYATDISNLNCTKSCCNNCLSSPSGCTFFVYLRSEKICMLFNDITWSDLIVEENNAFDIGSP